MLLQLQQPSQHHQRDDLCRRGEQRNLSGKIAAKVERIKNDLNDLFPVRTCQYVIFYSVWSLCRATLVDHCNANKVENGFKLALPVLEYLVPHLNSLKSMPEFLSLSSGSLITWQGQMSALPCSAPMAQTLTTTLHATPQHHLSSHSLWSCRW